MAFFQGYFDEDCGDFDEGGEDKQDADNPPYTFVRLSRESILKPGIRDH